MAFVVIDLFVHLPKFSPASNLITMMRETKSLVAELFNHRELQQFVRDYYPEYSTQFDLRGSPIEAASNIIDVLCDYEALDSAFYRYLLDARSERSCDIRAVREKELGQQQPKGLRTRLVALRNGIKQLRNRSPEILRISDLHRIQRAISDQTSRPHNGGCALLAAWIRQAYEHTIPYPSNLGLNSVEQLLDDGKDVTQDEFKIILKGAPQAASWLQNQGYAP